ncbi:MAG: GtrA family protein [Lactobacillaceae bacterium]|jgi:putative flippase GtrA|nr:GtrA family protein [Lactobacillaceae bacterium]
MQTMQTLFKKYQSQILYLIFGVSTTIVNIIVYGVMHMLHMPYQVSYWTAWFWAVLFAYLTNRVWVFHSQASGFVEKTREVVQFYIARLLTGVLGAGIMWIGVSLLHQNDVIWNIIQNVFVILTNYALSKYIIFNKKEKWNRNDD